MELSDQGRRSRLVTGGLGDALARRGPPAPPGAPTLVVQVYDGGAMPSGTPGRFNCYAVQLTGSDAEGAAPGVTVATDRTVVVTVWGKVPSVGDFLAAERGGGYWNAVNGGGPAPSSVCGGCSLVPKVLTGGSAFGSSPPTLTYGPRPAGVPGVIYNINNNIGANTYPNSWYSPGAPALFEGGFPGSVLYYFLRFTGCIGIIQSFYYVPGYNIGYPGGHHGGDWVMEENADLSFDLRDAGNTCTPFSVDHWFSYDGSTYTTNLLHGTHGSDDIPLDSHGSSPGV